MPHRSEPLFSSCLATLSILALTVFSGAALGSEPDNRLHTGLLPSDPTKVKALPVAPIYTDYIPARVDLARNLPPVGDQGGVGSCAAWATGYAARAYYVSWLEGRDVAKPENIPSPQFIYSKANAKPGDCDGGSDILDIMQMLEKGGAPSLADVPYSDKALLDAKCPRPTAQEIAKKRDFYVDNAYVISPITLDQLKAELTQGHPIVISMNVGHSFKAIGQGMTYRGEWKGYYAGQFVADVPAAQGLGRHAVTLVGYDDTRQAFKLMNSWGTKWGDQGFTWISYKVAVDPRMVNDAYVMLPGRAPP